MQDMLLRLGRMVANERKKRKYTQKDLAGRTGVSRSTLQKIEAGIPVRTDGLVMVMDELGLTISTRDVDAHRRSSAVATCILTLLDGLSAGDQTRVWQDIDHHRRSNI